MRNPRWKRLGTVPKGWLPLALLRVSSQPQEALLQPLPFLLGVELEPQTPEVQRPQGERWQRW